MIGMQALTGKDTVRYCPKIAKVHGAETMATNCVVRRVHLEA